MKLDFDNSFCPYAHPPSFSDSSWTVLLEEILGILDFGFNKKIIRVWSFLN